LDVSHPDTAHASRDFRTPLRKAHACVWHIVHDGLKKLLAMLIDVLTGVGQDEKQIPRRMAAPFVPQGRRDDKFVERRVETMMSTEPRLF